MWSEWQEKEMDLKTTPSSCGMSQGMKINSLAGTRGTVRSSSELNNKKIADVS